MATGTFLGEKFWTLGQGIIAEQSDCAAAGNTGGRSGQNPNTSCFAVGLGSGCLISGIAPILGHGHPGQQPSAGEKAAEQTDIEAVTQPPLADEWHQKNQTEYEG